MSPLAELKHFLCSFAVDLRRRRQWHDLLDVQAAADITAEADADASARRHAAFAARVADDEGLALLEQVARDGTLTADELPIVLKSMRHIRRSRELDHTLADAEPHFRAPPLSAFNSQLSTLNSQL